MTIEHLTKTIEALLCVDQQYINYIFKCAHELGDKVHRDVISWEDGRATLGIKLKHKLIECMPCAEQYNDIYDTMIIYAINLLDLEELVDSFWREALIDLKTAQDTEDTDDLLCRGNI